MKRTAFSLLVLLALAGCSATEPENDALDELTLGFIRARAEVPAFGGVAVNQSHGGLRPVVFTLGAEPAAAPVVLAIFG